MQPFTNGHANGAINGAVQAGVQTDSELWFSHICEQLLPKDAGFALHVATDIDERSCYRYASGERQVPGGMLRLLLRSKSGWTWLCGVMDGCEEQWWLDIKKAKERVEKVRSAIE